MFGIGGGEFIVIILFVLMFFGADKIPDMARTLGKGIAQLKNATNDIKSEIQGSGIDVNSLTGGISEEINKAKEGFTKMVNDSEANSSVKSELDQIRENFASMSTDPKPQPAITPNRDVVAENSEIADAPESATDLEGPVKRQS